MVITKSVTGLPMSKTICGEAAVGRHNRPRPEPCCPAQKPRRSGRLIPAYPAGLRRIRWARWTAVLRLFWRLGRRAQTTQSSFDLASGVGIIDSAWKRMVLASSPAASGPSHDRREYPAGRQIHGHVLGSNAYLFDEIADGAADIVTVSFGVTQYLRAVDRRLPIPLQSTGWSSAPQLDCS